MNELVSRLVRGVLRTVPLGPVAAPLSRRLPWPPSRKPDHIEDVFGTRLRFDASSHLARTVWAYGCWERNTVLNLAKLLRPGTVFVDAGAGAGYYSLFVARTVPESRVVAFEPYPPARAALEENLELNGVENVEVVPMGLSDGPGRFTVGRTGHDRLNAGFHRRVDDPLAASVEALDLDSFCRDRGIEEIDLLKVDVEGHETACIEGAEGILAASDDAIVVVEFVEWAEGDSARLYGQLRAMGFQGYYPRGWPYFLSACQGPPPPSYQDNLIFLKR